MRDRRRHVPRTDHVLDDPRLQPAITRLGRQRVKEAVHEAQRQCRDGGLAPEQVAAAAVDSLPASASSLAAVINATGVIVHTNLGRAPLSAAALEAVEAAGGATDVEMDLETGHRARRGRSALDRLGAAVPDAEGVHVVNNGAAALALAARVLAAGKNIVIARGELVEIGDGFRIPELVESTGARLREVGTTNRVALDDYARAVDEDTAFVLKVHTSNFVLRGFTSAVSVGELSRLAVPVVADIGSGLLRAHPRLPDEPDAASALQAGAELVTASGDKLLGGPQCGLLLGREDIVRELRRHPLARAMRVDKLTLAAVEATLVGPTPPVAEALARTPKSLRERAERISAELQRVLGDGYVEVVATRAAVGGGGAPEVGLDSAAVALPATLAHVLRTRSPAVVGRVHERQLLLDLIAVPPRQDPVLVESVCRAVRET